MNFSYSVVVDGKAVSCYSSLRRARQDYELIRVVAPEKHVSINCMEVK